MRHPSKVGAFCSRKLARGASDSVLGGGRGPLPCGKHLTKGLQMPARERRPWWLRIRDSMRARKLISHDTSEPR